MQNEPATWHYLVIVRDISIEKARMNLLKKLSLGMEQAASIVLIADHCGIVEYVNPEFEKATGYRKDEVIGKKTNILSSGMTPQKIYRELWETISRGEVFRGVLINRRKNG